MTRAGAAIVSVRYVRGRRVTLALNGAQARSVQHDVDHLRGWLPTERLAPAGAGRGLTAGLSAAGRR